MSVHNGKPTSYKISISEEQRVILMRAMEQLIKTDEEEVVLYTMLDDLPRDELATPGCLHGLCL